MPDEDDAMDLFTSSRDGQIAAVAALGGASACRMAARMGITAIDTDTAILCWEASRPSLTNRYPLLDLDTAQHAFLFAFSLGWHYATVATNGR